MLIFISSAINSASLSEYTSVANKGVYDLKIKVNSNHEASQKVLLAMNKYENWIFHEFNALNKSPLYSINIASPKYLKKDGADYFSFNTDIKFFFLTFSELLTFKLYQIEIINKGFNFSYALISRHKNVKDIYGKILFRKKKKSSDFIVTISVEPSWLLYKLIPLSLIDSAIMPRVEKIISNFETEVKNSEKMAVLNP